MRAGNFGGPCVGCNLANNPMMANLLNLTDAQKSAIQAESNSAAEQTKALQEQLRDTRRQISEAVTNAASDSTLEGLAKQVGALESEILTISLKARSTIHNQILTADQRAKLAKLRTDRWNQRDQRWNRTNRGRFSRPTPVLPPAAGPNGL